MIREQLKCILILNKCKYLYLDTFKHILGVEYAKLNVRIKVKFRIYYYLVYSFILIGKHR